MMRIAIDYDGTYTRTPNMWDAVIRRFESNHIDVVCVSSRRNTEGNRQEIECAMAAYDGVDVPIYLTGYEAKAEVMDNLGLHVDIWIDDDPKTIDPNGVIDKPQFDKWKESGK